MVRYHFVQIESVEELRFHRRVKEFKLHPERRVCAGNVPAVADIEGPIDPAGTRSEGKRLRMAVWTRLTAGGHS